MKTTSVKAEDIKREWHTIDASEEVLGKLATRAANLLMGKHKPLFARNADVGDFVVVTNAAKIQVPVIKRHRKNTTVIPDIRWVKNVTMEKLMETYPERVIEHAVKECCPRII